MKKFKFRMNTATLIFLVAYAVYILYLTFWQRNFKDLPLVVGFGVLAYAFFLGCRPYGYEIGKRTLIIKYFLWKNSEVDLMQCETICDPVSRWADIATRPHAIEIYTNTKKRYCCFPKQRIEFVDAIVQENKRIHCTVKEYTDVRRKLDKKRRKERKKAERNGTE
ncbi:MAG: PH domain-containing protein [Erysipelotrichales bacterium]|nr:PH domain-containing protein [Erysipelotrichales bacterium]